MSPNLSLAILLLVAQSNFAQSIDKLRAKFPKDDAVYTQLSNHYFITNDNGKLNAICKVDESIAYLTNKDIHSTNNTVYYSSFSSIKDIKAYTEVPVGKGRHHKTQEVTNFNTKSSMSGGVFYDDRKTIEFSYPNVVQGAITHLSYSEEFNDTHFLNPYFFSANIPVINAELKVTFPKNVMIDYLLFGEDTSNVKFNKTNVGDNIEYTWYAKNTLPVTYEPDAPSRTYYGTQLIFRISSYEANGVWIPLLGNVTDLYNWDVSLLKNLNSTDETALKQKVSELIKDIDNDAEKAKAIYQWVQQNIKYIAFEDGMGGFVPRNASDIYNKKYGDCKDMANLLCQMLKHGGLNAYLTWIGTRSKPYTYEQVPTPIVDNHMIAALKIGGKTIFLDGTGSYIPFGLPSPFIQGKEALIGIDSEHFEILKVPEVDKAQNIKTDSTYIKINVRDVLGEGHVHLTGFEKLTFHELYFIGNPKAEKDFFLSFLKKGSNKFDLKNYKVVGLTDPNVETDITYQYIISDYIKISGNKLFVNLNLEKPLTNEDLDLEQRKHDREFEYKFLLANVVTLVIPDGYKLEFLPTKSGFKADSFGFSISYTQSRNLVTLHRDIYINTLSVNRSDFEKWNDFISLLNKAYKETLVLTKQQQ